ncbi:MAG: GNAT family protein [Ginsengibacter sp.]
MINPSFDITRENIVLQNDKVLLRPLEEKDLENFLFFSLNEADIFKYSIFSPGGSEENMKKYIADYIKQKDVGKEYAFVVIDKVTNSYAGCTRFYDIQLENNSTQLGYTWYGKAFQRTGLNRICKWLLLEFAFEKWGIERVEFRADAQNEPSIKAMQAIGCTVEGILRSCVSLPFQDRRRDSIILSILKDEWFDHVKRDLAGKIY